MIKNIYIQNEAKNNFKDWTKQGLEFLLLYSHFNKKIKFQIELKLNGDK